MVIARCTHQEGDTEEKSDPSSQMIRYAAKGIGANEKSCQVCCLSQRFEMIFITNQPPLEKKNNNQKKINKSDFFLKSSLSFVVSHFQ